MPRKRLNPRRRPGDYEVGKGRPPVASRWKPGQCGNPKGRPKKAKGAATMAREALERPLPVIVNGRKYQMSVRAVAYRKLADRAAGGDGKALFLLLHLENEFQQSEPTDAERTVFSKNDAEIIDRFLKRRSKSEDGGG